MRLCGNLPELGNWDPSKAMALNTNPSIYPIWFNETSLEVNYGNRLRPPNLEII